MDSDVIRRAAMAMAAQELLPGQPSDLSAILTNRYQLDALMAPRLDAVDATELVLYLRENIDPGRIDWWHKHIDRLVHSRIATPILAGSDEYPRRLARCWDAPPLLFATAPIPAGPTVAIVGSRQTTTTVLDQTRALGAELAAAGIVVVSGLAAGVDAAAHRGALDVGGSTVAVMGTGITRVYPRQNHELAEQIRQHGVLVSQFAPDAPRTATTFLRRNHVIAGLSQASIVMDAQERSGSRHEAQQASAYGRPVFLWASALVDQKWARAMAADGEATFVNCAKEILGHLADGANL